MDQASGSMHRTRRAFACIVYVVTIIWLILAMAQWLMVSLMEPMKEECFLWISVVFFVLALLLSLTYILFEKVRLVNYLNWLFTFLVVEFATVGLSALVTGTLWPDLIMGFGICFLLLFLFVLLGSFIPVDLTLNIVVLIVLSVAILFESIYMLMMSLLKDKSLYLILFQVGVSIVVLMFVMYHAQTINGGRFAEIRTDEYRFAALTLFFSFIVIFLLSFHMMNKYKIASNALFKTTNTKTSNENFWDIIRTTTPTTFTTTPTTFTTTPTTITTTPIKITTTPTRTFDSGLITPAP